MGGPEAPQQGGELALGRGCADVTVHSAQHRGVGGPRATRDAVDVVKLWRQAIGLIEGSVPAVWVYTVALFDGV